MMISPPFQSTHKLDFMACPWPRDPEYIAFKIGTCHGLYTSKNGAYAILAVENDCPGNGHFQDVMEWFENSCRRDGKNLVFLELMNKRLKKHLLGKGFKPLETDHLIKTFACTVKP